MGQDDLGDVIVARGGALLEAQTGAEMVGLDLGSGTCFGFNDTAYRIWQLVEQPMPLQQLCDTLAGEFDVDPVTCAREVRTLLDDLAGDGLIKLTTRS